MHELLLHLKRRTSQCTWAFREHTDISCMNMKVEDTIQAVTLVLAGCQRQDAACHLVKTPKPALLGSVML